MNAVAVRNPRRVAALIPSERPEPVMLLASEEFSSVSALSSQSPQAVPVPHEHERTGFLYELRLYTGAALVGTVLCGLAFGWYEHRETVQWIGAAVGLAVCAVVRLRQQRAGA